MLAPEGARAHGGKLVLAAAVAALALPGLGRAADLVAVSAWAQAYAHPGGHVAAGATIGAKGRVSATSQLRFYLSADRKLDKKDVLLKGGKKIPGLKAGQRFKAYAVATVPAGAPVGSDYLLACADDLRRVHESNERNNCVAAKARTAVAAEPVTSAMLIEAAVAAGKISPQTGLLYRTYAAFADKRLPARYIGDATTVSDDSVLTDVQAQWSTLPSSAKAKLRPFFLPPAARGSWYSKQHKSFASSGRVGSDDPCGTQQLAQPDWADVSAVGGKIRIWYTNTDPVEHQVALSTARWINIAYPKFKTLMGREPISDEGTLCYHGPDGALDIYLVHYNLAPNAFLTWTKGLTISYPPWCSGAPAFILLQAYAGPPYFKVEIVATKWIVAHELFHAFQYAFPYSGPCNDYNWFDEGSASWGANYAFPDDNTEHERDGLLTTPRDQLRSFDYATWPFDLFLEKTLGAATIKGIYDAFATHKPMAGIDSAIPGGFRKQWPIFTRYGWNQDPITPSFAEWDSFPVLPTPSPELQLDLGTAHQVTKDAPISGLETHPGDVFYGKMGPLTRTYDRFAVADSDIRYLKFKNTLSGVTGAGVQAIVTYADGHKVVQDWTSRDTVEFCFDDSSGPGDDVSKLVVMYSNSNWLEEYDSGGKHPLTVSEQPSVQVRDACESYNYKILAATLTTNAHGTVGFDTCTIGGTITTNETRVLSSVLGTQPSPPVSKLEPTMLNGVRYVSGQLDAKVTATYTDSVDGCQINPAGDPFLIPCQYTAPPQTINTDAQVVVDSQPWTDSTSSFSLHWSLPSAEIGVASGSYPTSCFFDYMLFNVPYEDTAATVPVSKFIASGPQTVSFSGSKHMEKPDVTGVDTMDYSWTMSLTYERVDANGNAL